MYVIYLDVLFFINWLMNTLIFYCVTLILNERVKNRTVILAGAVAACFYCMLLIVPILQRVPYAIYAFIIPIPSILMLYKPHHYKSFLKQYLVSMLSAALFGGVTFNIWYLVNDIHQRVTSVSILMLAAIGIGVSLCFYCSFYWIRKRFILPTFEYTLAIHYQEKEVKIQSLLDTGNLLYTPSTHKPVLVAEYMAVRPLLTEAQQQTYEHFCELSIEEVEKEVINGLYQWEDLIPFNSVGCKGGFLWSIEVENISIYKQGMKKIVPKCTLGIASHSLFNDGQYHALLHPDFILEEVQVS